MYGTVGVRHFRAILGLLAALVPASCRLSDESRSAHGDIIHPDPDRYILPVPPSHRLAQGGAEEAATAASLEIGSSLAHVGELDGPAEYVIGKVRDMSVDEDGNLVILDSRYNDVRIYDASGQYLASAGGPGEGPGEFARPTALGVGRHGRVYVADVRMLRLTIFQRTDEGLTLDRTLTLTDLSPIDLCVLDDRIVIHGFRLETQAASELLHVFDENLQHSVSFGRVYSTDHPYIQSSLSRGHVLCVPPDKIIFVPAGLPMIYAFSIDGEPLWITTIAQYRPFPYIERPGEILNPIPDDGANQTLSVVAAPNGWIIVQVATVTHESRDAGAPFGKLETYAVRAESGKGAYLGTGLPLLGYVDQARAVTVEEVPFPRLEVRGVTTFFGQ